MSFLKKLQNTDEATKKIALVAGSIVCMALIMFLWLHFSGPLIKNKTEQAQAPGRNSSSFLANVKNGGAYLWQRASGLIRAGADALTSPKSYTIQPQSNRE